MARKAKRGGGDAGMPVGVFKLCPKKTHVIERKVSHCAYCSEDEAAKGGKRNPVDPVDRLREANEPTDSVAPTRPPPLPPTAKSGRDGLVSTRIVDASEGNWQSKPEVVPEPPPPLRADDGPSTAQLGPAGAAASDPFQTKPYGTPVEPQTPRPDDPLGRTMPLQAAGGAAVPHSSTQVLIDASGATAPPKQGVAATPVVGWLRALNGPRGGSSWEVREDRNLIGADPGCSIQLEGVTVQPRHASLRGDTFMLTRTDTKGDLRVNDKSVDQARLYDGDLVHVGEIALRFRCLTTDDLQEVPRDGGGAAL